MGPQLDVHNLPSPKPPLSPSSGQRLQKSSSLRRPSPIVPEVGASDVFAPENASDELHPKEQGGGHELRREGEDDDAICVAITGGAGQIAYTLVALIMQGRVFGERRRVRLRLLDIDACAGVLEGVAMEIRDCYCDLASCFSL